jgi:hypothetical protein
VLAGRIMGKAQAPLDPRPLTEQLEDRYKEYEYD